MLFCVEKSIFLLLYILFSGPTAIKREIEALAQGQLINQRLKDIKSSNNTINTSLPNESADYDKTSVLNKQSSTPKSISGLTEHINNCKDSEMFIGNLNSEGSKSNFTKQSITKCVESADLSNLLQCRMKKSCKNNTVKSIHMKEKCFSCHICLRRFVRRDTLNHHLLTHAGETPYNCEICDYRCSQKNRLVVHMKHKHLQEKKFACDMCVRKFVRRDSLNLHLLTHTGEKPHKCDMCDYRCLRNYSLKQHIMVKHKNEKKFSCHMCSNTFVRKDILNKHLLTHTGEKPFKCNMCEYMCLRKYALDQHVMFKHKNEKNFSCHMCICKFARKDSLNRHLRVHTGDKPYICDLCDYRSIRKSNLSDHIKSVHTKEKNFLCHMCLHRFISKYNLNIHLRTHTGEKRFTCDLCDYGCLRKDYLEKHIKTKHMALK